MDMPDEASTDPVQPLSYSEKRRAERRRVFILVDEAVDELEKRYGTSTNDAADTVLSCIPLTDAGGTLLQDERLQSFYFPKSGEPYRLQDNAAVRAVLQTAVITGKVEDVEIAGFESTVRHRGYGFKRDEFYAAVYRLDPAHFVAYRPVLEPVKVEIEDGRVAALRREVAALKAENEALKVEREALKARLPLFDTPMMTAARDMQERYYKDWDPKQPHIRPLQKTILAGLKEVYPDPHFTQRWRSILEQFGCPVKRRHGLRAKPKGGA
jgi:hypothetical protein